MTTLTELFQQSKAVGPVNNGAYVRSRAAQVIRDAGFRLKKFVSITRPNDGVVMGIAFYSLPDLQLLDELVQASKSGHSYSIDIFDVLDCKSMADFDQLIPGVTPVYQTPVVGIWESGKLIEKAWGATARQLILDKYIQ